MQSHSSACPRNHRSNSKRAAVVPSLVGAPTALSIALRRCGIAVEEVADLSRLPCFTCDIMIVNIAGFGSPREWGRKLKDLISMKRAVGIAGLPTLLVEPEPREWEAIGGWASEIDAYIADTQPTQRFVEMLCAILRRPDDHSERQEVDHDI